MRILILGASGFVGSNLKIYLSRLYTVFTASRSVGHGDFQFDITDKATYAIFDNQFDVVVNCIVDYNLPLTTRLYTDVDCKAAFLGYIAGKDIHYIDISSISALAENKALSEYNFSKFLSDEVTSYVCSQNRTTYSILRFAQIFDFDEKASRMQKALYYFIDAFRGQKILNVFGDAEAKRSYMPVDILVKTVHKTIAEKITGVHAIIMPDSYSANDLIKSFNSILPIPEANLVFKPGESVISYHIPSCSSAFADYLSKQDDCTSFFRALLTK